MPGDYSRNTFDPSKHYSGVLMQQGRVQLDADWNEQQAIAAHRARTAAEDAIGPSGAPKQGGGFRMDKTADGKNLTISAGRFYVSGLLCELEEQEDGCGVDYLSQPDHPIPEFSQTIDSKRELAMTQGTYLAYLDAWEQEVNALVDPHIRETALGDADTATRRRVVWQVRLKQLVGNPMDCNALINEWAEIIATPSGKLNARTVTPPPSSNPCQLPPTAGYRRLENQLYRVEVHQGGPLGTAAFKWSRDNGTVETKIKKISGAVLSVADVGKDDVLGFAAEQWVEIIDHEAEVENAPHQLVQIEHVDGAKREISLKTSAADLAGKLNLRLRRWDQKTGASEKGMTTSGDWLELEDGIQVTFSDGNYRAGDFWLIPARTISGIEWPPYEVPGGDPLPQKHHGVEHRYGRLGLVRVGVSNNITNVDDCRDSFPSLTQLCAEDVRFKPQACGPEFASVRTVQQALELFCKTHGSGCTYFATEGTDLQSIINDIRHDAAICLAPGDYRLEAPLDITNKGRLKITGSGSSTRIIADNSESAMSFTNCKEVVIHDLHVESGVLSEGNQLNGALNFIACERLVLAGVSAKCAGGTRRAASCITIRQTDTQSTEPLPRPSVRVGINQCDLEVGHRQIGILMVDIENAIIESNHIHAAPRPAALRFSQLVTDKYYRTRIKAGLIANSSYGQTAPSGGNSNVNINAGEQTLHFRTPPMLKSEWVEYVREHPPSMVTTGQSLLAYIAKAADAMILDPALRTKPFKDWFDLIQNESRSTLSQGVVVAGRVAEEVRVRDNTIKDALQGIHIGLSHKVSREKDPVEGRVDQAGTITVVGNTIEVILPLEAAVDERHGIFVGNCESLAIESNRIKLNRFPGTDKISIEGIRVFGHIGSMAIIQRNHLSGFSTGIAFIPRFPYPSKRTILWSITENLAQEAKNNHTVVVPHGAPVDRRMNRPPHHDETV